MTLHELAEKTRTREDLVAFLEAYYQNFLLCEDNRNDESVERSWRGVDRPWEHSSLESFLEALSAFAKDSQRIGYANFGEDLETLPPVRLLAKLLVGARYYE